MVTIFQYFFFFGGHKCQCDVQLPLTPFILSPVTHKLGQKIFQDIDGKFNNLTEIFHFFFEKLLYFLVELCFAYFGILSDF